jgi:hypothetical protein
MNGIQSLMQGAPTSPQPTQAPAMPAQNDPQMAAAMDVVDNDLDKLDLDPRTKALLKTQEAFDLIQSAQNELAMSQPQPMPPTIEGQRQMQTMEGIAGILRSLGPGMQQRGQQVQQAQARQMMGGLPTQPAPNMRFAASGGLIGYNEGGDIMGPPEPNLYQRMGQGLKNYGANAQESMGILKAVKAGIGVPYEERSAVMKQVRDEIAAQNQNRDPNFIERMGQKLMNAGLNVEESKAILKKFYNTFGKTYEEMSNGMAMGGIVGYAGPDGSEVEYDYMSDPNLYAPTEVEQPDEGILRLARERMGRDPEAEALAAGQRLRELTGAEDLMKQREAAAAKLEAQRASRFSPEMERRRKLRAALAQGAEQGLGGFGKGYTTEEERIAGEKLSAAEASVADMDKLIGELRELGMSQFEAEKQARDMVERGIDQGMNTAQAVVDSIRRAQDAAANRATQERGQDITREVGLAQVAVPTDFMNEIQIRVSALQMDNPSLSKIEAQKQALEERIEAQAKAQLAANGVRAETLELERLKAAYSMAASRLANNPLAVTDYKAYRRAFDEEVKNITAQFMTPSGGNTGAGVPVPSSANDLVVGTVYNTARGPATWNGTSFIPVN